MPQFTDDVKKEITDALQKKGANLACPRCGGTDFGVLDGFPSNMVQKDTDQVITEADKMPSAGVVCNKCGNITQHALGILLSD